MMKGWHQKRLGDFVTAVSTGPFGSLLHKSDYVNRGVPLVNPINIIGNRIVPDQTKLIDEATKQRLSSYVLEVGDIVVGRRGEIGRCAVVGPRESGWMCGTGSFFIRPSSSIVPHFLAHLIRADQYREQLERSSTGTTMKNLSNTALGDLVIAVPSITEQQRIVSVLDEVFEGISETVANTERNIAATRELFDNYRNSIFGQKQPGWKKWDLSDICEIDSKLVDPRRTEFIDLPHIGAGNMVSITGELVDIQTAREERLKSGKFLFDKTIVLYSKIRPYLMKACRPEFRGLCSADVYPLSPKEAHLDRNFLFHILMSGQFTDYAIAGSDRAGMPKVNRDHLFRYRVWLPDINEQRRLAFKLDSISIETGRLEAVYQMKLASLAGLKQSIIKKAFTGELTVKSKNALEPALA